MIRKVEVKNRAGIHTRPAALIAQLANKYDSQIFIEKENTQINAKSIMGIITMAAGYKSEITLSAEGSDAEEALDAIEALFDNKFEED